MIESVNPVEIGVLILNTTSWQQGYAWTEEGGVRFVDSPKSLPNDIVWFCNAPYDILRGLGLYFKSDRFFRTPIEILCGEVMEDDQHIKDIAQYLGPMLKRMANTPESKSLRDNSTLAVVMAKHYSNLFKEPAPEWNGLSRSSLSLYWQGAIKHPTYIGGSLFPPRQEIAANMLGVQIPDFSQQPRKINGGEVHLESVLKDMGGFVSARVENISKDVASFISLNKTVWSTAEILWLSKHAKLTIKTLWLAPLIDHPMRNHKDVLEMRPFSWLDGLRLEAMVLAPGSKRLANGDPNIALKAYLRSVNHVLMAMHAEWLKKNHAVESISISFNKIGIMYSKREMERIAKASRSCGLIPSLPKHTSVDKQWRDDLFEGL